MSKLLGLQLDLARVALAVLCALPGAAVAEPVAFVVNEDSNSVTVVDVAARVVRAEITTADAFAGTSPTDAVFDRESGRIYVSAHQRLVSFDGVLSDGRGWVTVEALDEGSGLALDEGGRRLFMSHEAIPLATAGFVSEFSIAEPGAPRLVQQHTIPGMPDLRFIAWDPRFRRLYVVDDDGNVARTGSGNLTFSQVGSARAPNPGGILPYPAGGVWISSRGPGKLVHALEGGGFGVYPMADASHPRGLALDPEVSGAVLVAVDDRNRIRRLVPQTGVFSDAATTDLRPQDVAVSATGTIVSANRVGSSVNGSVSVGGMVIAQTGVTSLAMALAEVPRLKPSVTQQTFCYRVKGDRERRAFRIQNTRADRRRMDLGPLQVGGANPANYRVVGDDCSAARLSWGDACKFTLEFTASGPSVEPPPPFGGPPRASTWPAQVGIASTDGSASTTIALRANQQSTCPIPFP